jgi:chaperonin GroEL (HSP60 family)
LLIIPKAIAQNAGHDQQETIVKLQQEYTTSKIPVGIDVTTGMRLCMNEITNVLRILF